MLCNITQNAMRQTPGGGYPYPIMLCNITQNSMRQTPGGVPCQVRTGGGGGTLPGGWYPGRVPPRPGQDGGSTLLWEVPCWGEGTLLGGTQLGYPPGQVRKGGTLLGGTQVRYPPQQGGYPVRTTEGVITTRRAVCLLRSRRRTFLLYPKKVTNLPFFNGKNMVCELTLFSERLPNTGMTPGGAAVTGVALTSDAGLEDIGPVGMGWHRRWCSGYRSCCTTWQELQPVEVEVEAVLVELPHLVVQRAFLLQVLMAVHHL